jgi:MoxR-like ATPase
MRARAPLVVSPGPAPARGGMALSEPGPADPARALRAVIREASRGLVDREVLVDVIVLAAVAGEHVLVVGPPGTAKSEAARRVARALGGSYFEYLLGRFTEPSELFGAVDLAKLREGLVETDTTGMLPEAEIAFLDEVFQGSTAILNTLLGVLNDRVFMRGHTRKRCPLRLCVAATNALPGDASLAAFADRFLVRVFVEAVSDAMLEELLSAGWRLTRQPEQQEALASIAILDELAARARAVDLDAVVPRLAEAVRRLRAGGVRLSDRRVVRAQRLVAAAAALDGRACASTADLWPLVYVIPTPDEQAAARDLLAQVLETGDSALLQAAADEAARGPVIRARRLAEAADDLLASPPPAEAREAWRLRAEALLREVDAGFAEADRPAALAERRQRIVAALGAPGGE